MKLLHVVIPSSNGRKIPSKRTRDKRLNKIKTIILSRFLSEMINTNYVHIGIELM